MLIPPSRAKRVLETLKRAHYELQTQAESETDLPAWFVLTPAGAIRIQWIATFEPFVQFITPDEQIVLVAPEAVVVTMRKLDPAIEEQRVPIGFR